MILNDLQEINVLKIDSSKFDVNKKIDYEKNFEKIQDKGFIKKECKFYDSNWIYIKGGIEYNIKFLTDLDLKNIGREIGLNLTEIELAWKSFILRDLMIDLRKVNNTLLRFKDLTNRSKLQAGEIFNMMQFLEYISESTNEYLKVQEKLECMENIIYTDSKKIPNFRSIFKFIEIVDDIISNDKIEKYKEYIPIILWWKITSILPLRPTEFLRIKFNCIYENDNRYFFKIFRNLDKKQKIRKSDRTKEEGIYKEETIEITKETYFLIENMKNYISKLGYNTTEYLISKEFKTNTSNSQRNRFLNFNIFTADDLRLRLTKFYDKVIKNDYGQILVQDKKKSKQDNSIEMMTPYDSRHIAIINLVLIGTEPQTLMELAGHSDINSTYGYYNHIESYAQCYSIAYAKKLKENHIVKRIKINNHENTAVKTLNLVLNKTKRTKVEGGYCIYSNIEKDKSKCFLNEGNHTCCEYFISTKNENKKNINSMEKEMISEIKVLKDLVVSRSNISNFSELYSITSSKIKEDIQRLSIMRSKEDI